ncbi:hypothetical protein QBC47DRAFT_362033 [Echria macrotheca]|uniref:Uncharacterized protein n=1 Tax=Echria macrotheca TaxID=438768 RepID=A0AAJ0B991_9PEZI|nr:hypothetical protein QBC47DRAFT_362033 [Echria macrotheca]
MQIRAATILISSLLALAAQATPIQAENAGGQVEVRAPESQPDTTLVKRGFWTVYLYSTFNCNTSGSQGGYSSNGNFGCTGTNSASVDFDPQGCTARFYSDGGCRNEIFRISGTEQCKSSGGACVWSSREVPLPLWLPEAQTSTPIINPKTQIDKMASEYDPAARRAQVLEMLVRPTIEGGAGLTETAAEYELKQVFFEVCGDLFWAGMLDDFPWEEDYRDPQPGPLAESYNIYYTQKVHFNHVERRFEMEKRWWNIGREPRTTQPQKAENPAPPQTAQNAVPPQKAQNPAPQKAQNLAPQKTQNPAPQSGSPADDHINAFGKRIAAVSNQEDEGGMKKRQAQHPVLYKHFGKPLL